MTLPANAWSVNDFYDPKEKTALYEQVPRRYSCRRFLSAPSAAQWEALNAAAVRLCPPGARIVPALCQPTLFQTAWARMLGFENVQRYAAVLAAEGSPENVVTAGVAGEMFMLEAVRLGMAGVWVAGSYKRSEVTLPLQEGEKLLAVIALGVPFEDQPMPPRKRKPLEKLVDTPDGRPATGLLRDIATMVQAAPSAMNLQPWRLSAGEDGAILLRVSRNTFRLDLGIAAAHAILAAGSTPLYLTLEELTVRMKPAL